MGKDVKYKMLVRALNLDTQEELAQLVSEGFTVSFVVSECSFACVPIIWQNLAAIASEGSFTDT